jgi:hypothetical protein
VAPLESAITDLGWELLEMIPPVLRDDPDVRAVIHCHAREAEYAEGKIEELRNQISPLTATARGLRFWELLLRLPDGSANPDAARRTRILERYAALEGDPSARSWVDRVTGRIGTGEWSYVEHGEDPGVPTQTLWITLPWPAASVAYNAAIEAIRDETPSELELAFFSSDAGLFDVGEFDVSIFGV